MRVRDKERGEERSERGGEGVERWGGGGGARERERERERERVCE